MDTGSLNILVEAKKEYLKQLCSVMSPIIIETFQELYNESKKMNKGKNLLMQYQKLLKEVPNWNEHMVNTHCEKLNNSCSWFSDLLAAVFVSFVKILSAVRLKAENKKISIKLPSNQLFIHTCYINAAKNLYKDPYIYHDEMTDNDRHDILNARFRQCVEDTVDEMIPVQEILKSCMSQVTDSIDVESNADTTTEDPDVYDDIEEPQEPEEPEEPEEPQEPQEELKDIQVGPEEPQEPEEPEEVLFGDAPEEEKKPM